VGDGTDERLVGPCRRAEPSFHDRHDACRPKTVPTRRAGGAIRAVCARMPHVWRRPADGSAAAGIGAPRKYSADVTGGASSASVRR
jgi:hypothetical protein